jgi:hypothetical protein
MPIHNHPSAFYVLMNIGKVTKSKIPHSGIKQSSYKTATLLLHTTLQKYIA